MYNDVNCQCLVTLTSVSVTPQPTAVTRAGSAGAGAGRHSGRTQLLSTAGRASFTSIRSCTASPLAVVA